MSDYRRRLMMATPAKPPEPASDGWSWFYYVSTTDSESVSLMASKTGMQSTMKVDGVSKTTAMTYTFPDAGTHLVKYKRSTSGSYLIRFEGNQFLGITKLTEAYIVEGITTLNGGGSNGCFRGCTGLTKIVLPSTVTSIANRVFRDDTALMTVVCKATTPPTLGGTEVFNNCPAAMRIYVPYSEDHAVLDAYKAANYWSARSSYIFELTPDGEIPTT